MQITGVRQIQEILTDLNDRAVDLMRALMRDKEYWDCTGDLRCLYGYFYELSGITPAMIGTELYFYGAMYDAEDSMKDNHDSYEKLLFIMQKHFKLYLKRDLLPEIESFIIKVRDNELDDYRARDYQMDLARKLEMIRDYYEQRYNLD